MIRVSVSYPRTAGKRFDLEYYKNRHMPMVKELLTPIKVEVDAGLPNHQGELSPCIAVGHLTFESMEQLVTRYIAASQQLHADTRNYTDIEPIIQLSEIIEI